MNQTQRKAIEEARFPSRAWRVVLHRRTCGRRGLYCEICRTNDGVIGEQIDGGDFDSVAAGNERCHRDETFDGKLLAALVKMIGSFCRSPDFLLIFSDA